MRRWLGRAYWLGALLALSIYLTLSCGLLAMANGGPDTNGSQFFITFGPTEHLNGLHTVFGEVVEGDDVLAALDLRDPDAPTGRGDVIESITIIEG